MKNYFEKVLTAVLIVAFVLAALGIVIGNDTLTSTGFVVLSVLSITVSVMQVRAFLSPALVAENNNEKTKAQMLQMIVSVVVALAILAVTIFGLAGKVY